jgi:hypothetical protein
LVVGLLSDFHGGVVPDDGAVQPGHGAGPANAGELAGPVDHIAFDDRL